MMTNLTGANWNSSAGPKGGGQDAQSKKQSSRAVNEHLDKYIHVFPLLGAQSAFKFAPGEFVSQLLTPLRVVSGVLYALS